MSQIEYITDGFNQQKARVILWRLGNYQYQLEINGENFNFEAEYYDALRKFNDAVTIRYRHLDLCS